MLVLVVMGLGLHIPTLFFDDAYITFRYAANLAAGDGLTYNPEERVLGTSTPLFALLLAAASLGGFDVESAALAFGIAGHALIALALFELCGFLIPGVSCTSVLPRAAAALACALHPHMVFMAVGGMETPLSVALLFGALAAAASSRAVVSGLLIGLAQVARPDAFLMALPAAWLLTQSRQPRDEGVLARFAAAAAAAAGPWLVFAAWYYGSPVPHSIAAKRMIHPCGPIEVLGDFGRFFLDDVALLTTLPLVVLGLWFGRRLAALWAVAAYVVLYLAACVFSGVTPFPWYVNPLLPAWIGLAATGASGLIDLARLLVVRRLAWIALIALTAAGAGGEIRRQQPGLEESWDAWEGAYEVMARWILENSQPGDRVYVGEVGVVGYLLPGRIIIDSSGINSPRVSRLRRGRLEEDPEWSRQVIQQMDPDFIATSLTYLHARTLSQESWFAERYARADVPLLEPDRHLVYRRRPER